MKNGFLALTVLGFSILALYCSNPPTAGNGTQTGNAIGRLAKADGSPAAGVTVYFYDVDNNPRESLTKARKAGLSLKAFAVAGSTVTDDSGNFTDSLPDGMYNMMAGDDSTGVYQDSIEVAGDTATLPDDTLRQYGSIAGVIKLHGTDDSRTVSIIAMGTNRWVEPVDTSGSFTFGNLAQGTYSIRIRSTLDDYGVLDTSFAIQSGRNDTLGEPLDLPYYKRNLDTPTNIKAIVFTDTILSFSWSTVPYATNYAIYRSNSAYGTYDSVALVTDTIYNDTNITEATSYYYKIKAFSLYGTSELSSAIEIVSAPLPPDSLSVIVLSSDSIRITWTTVQGATSYIISRKSSVDTAFDSIDTSVDTSYVDATVDTGNTYAYRIEAVNGTARSRPSRVDSVKLKGFGLFVSKPFYTAGKTQTKLWDLNTEDCRNLNLEVGDTLYFKVNSLVDTIVIVQDNAILPEEVQIFDDLLLHIGQTINLASPNGATATLSSNGALTVNAADSDLVNFQVRSNNSSADSLLKAAFTIRDTIPAGMLYSTAEFRRPAGKLDQVRDLFDENGNPVGREQDIGQNVGLENGAKIVINGVVNGRIALPETLTYSTEVPHRTRVGDLEDLIQSWGTSHRPGTVLNARVNEADSAIAPHKPGAFLVQTVGVDSLWIEASDAIPGNSALPDKFNENIIFVGQ